MSGCVLLMVVAAAAAALPVLVGGCGRGSVFLRQNGYRQVLVAIDDEVTEDARLVERIREVFTNASRLLYQMSRQRAYFADVHILIPESWPDDVTYSAPSWQQVDKSDVTVGPVPRGPGQGEGQGQGDAPFTVRTTPCGELGQLIHLTPQYLLNDSVGTAFGPYEKVFLHEWSHLRYGVFDEYNDDDDGHFYAASNGELEGVRCPALLKGEMWDSVSQSRFCRFVNGQPDSNCRFLPDVDSLPTRSASLMFHTHSPQVSEWCDDDVSRPETLHNRQASNQHNRQCGGRSVWEVLRNHGDFRDGQNPPSNLTTPTAPVFTLVKPRWHRTVLVLDVSGSMGDNDRIGRLAQAASNYLLRVAREGERVGIVWFKEAASIQVNLTQINNVTRRELLQHVPKDAVGGTAIGDGLLKGLEVLHARDGGSVQGGGSIILLSDGIETHPPWVKDVIPQVKNSNVRVHTIAVSGEADVSLEVVATETGGLSFSYSDTTPSNTLNDAFLAMADAGVPLKQKQLQILSRTLQFDAGQFDVIAFLIDPTANSDVTVAIGYTENNTLPVATLTSPSGNHITSTSPEYELESSFRTVYISLGLTAETGEYRLNVTNPAPSQQTLFLTVTARMGQAEEAPVVVTAQWRHQTVTFPSMQQALYVSVSKGYGPVLLAEVVATVENPPVTSSTSATSSALLLLDNGAGSDVKRDDGIYSSYVTSFTATGRYNVHVVVRDVTGTVVSDGVVGVGVPRSAARVSRTGHNRNLTPVQPFQRFSSAGSFRLEGYDASSGDVYPPSRVSDLTVRGVGATNVELEWTAPGDDLDQGTAAGYVLKMSTDFEVLYNNHSLVTNVSDQHILAGHLHTPQASGHRDSVTVHVTGGAATYYFAIQAYDNSSNISPLSNIAGATTAFAAQQSSTFDTVVLMIVIPIVTVLLVVVTVVAVCVYRRRVRNKDLERQRRKVMHAI